jgi:hypothetical protein
VFQENCISLERLEVIAGDICGRFLSLGYKIMVFVMSHYFSVKSMVFALCGIIIYLCFHTQTCRFAKVVASQFKLDAKEKDILRNIVYPIKNQYLLKY